MDISLNMERINWWGDDDIDKISRAIRSSTRND